MPFSLASLEFLFENRLHDSREWFEEHKESYRRLLLEPLAELTVALTPTMQQIDPRFVTEPRVDKTICRIRRDTRFSHDKSLYRDHLWIIFKRDRMHTTQFPGVYFEVGCDGFNYGCGFYQASTSYMSLLREQVLDGSKRFQAAQQAHLALPQFIMEGDCYRRPHFAGQPQSLRDWLERRNLCFVAESTDLELLFSNRLADFLRPQFQALAPIYQFLLDVALEETHRSNRPGAESL